MFLFLNLFMFKTGVAVFAVEISPDKNAPA
jgi:hypothetical protein